MNTLATAPRPEKPESAGNPPEHPPHITVYLVIEGGWYFFEWFDWRPVKRRAYIGTHEPDHANRAERRRINREAKLNGQPKLRRGEPTPKREGGAS